MKKQQFVEIKYNDYTAIINPSMGANCISLRNSKYKAVILREPDYSKELDNPYLYGMPILFPVNRISNGEFYFEGRKYTFPINEPATNCHLHGLLHETPFDLAEESENKVVCVYRTDENNSYLDFPHCFEVKLTYELSSKGLMQKTEIANLSDKNMPLFLGFHTTFNSLFTVNSKHDDINVLAQISKEFERNMNNFLPTGRISEFDEVSQKISKGIFNPFEKPVSRHYLSGEKNRMIIYDSGNNISLVYENDEKLKFRLIYNGDANGYICLEPQTCLANCQNSPFDREEAGFDFIRPGEAKTYYSKIYLEEGDKR